MDKSHNFRFWPSGGGGFTRMSQGIFWLTPFTYMKKLLTINAAFPPKER